MALWPLKEAGGERAPLVLFQSLESCKHCILLNLVTLIRDNHAFVTR